MLLPVPYCERERGGQPLLDVRYRSTVSEGGQENVGDERVHFLGRDVQLLSDNREGSEVALVGVASVFIRGVSDEDHDEKRYH
jgi:hypothetical protein